MPVAGAAVALFTIWMLIDAHERRVESYWIWIILMPFGGVAYFFYYKIHDFVPNSGSLILNKSKPRTLKELRYNARVSPSALNRQLLADRLVESREYREASDLYEALLKEDSTNKEFQFGFAVCLKELGRSDQAIDILQAIAAEHLEWSDFRAASALAEILLKHQRYEEALPILQARAEKSMRINHELELSECLLRLGQRQEAKKILTLSLEHYQHSPPFYKKTHRSSQKNAKRLLNSLSQEVAA